MIQSQTYSDFTAERPEGTCGFGRCWTQPSLLMRNNKVSGSGSNPQREPFITIDDLRHKAQELFQGLRKLSEYRHPLDIRRGARKGVEKSMNKRRDSKQIKAGGRTYFLDIEEKNEGKPYLRITESRKGDKDEWKRNSIIVFPENADEFAEAVSEMAAKLG